MIDYDKGRAATRALNYVENGWGLSLRRIRSWIPVRYFPILGRRPVNCRALFNNDNTVGLRMPSHRQRDINTAENMLNNIGVKYHKEQQQDGTISIIIDEGSINHLISYSRANWFDRRHVRLNKQGWPAATGNKTEVTPFGTVNVGPVPPTAAQDPAAITPDQWRKMQGQWNSLCGGGCALAGSSLRYEPDRSIVADSGKCTYKYSNRQNVDVLFDKTATPADMDKYFLALVTQAHAMGMKTINCTSTNEEFNTRLGAACAALGVTPPMKFEPSPQQVPAPAPTPAPAPAPAPSLAPEVKALGALLDTISMDKTGSVTIAGGPTLTKKEAGLLTQFFDSVTCPNASGAIAEAVKNSGLTKTQIQTLAKAEIIWTGKSTAEIKMNPPFTAAKDYSKFNAAIKTARSNMH